MYFLQRPLVQFSSGIPLYIGPAHCTHHLYIYWTRCVARWTVGEDCPGLLVPATRPGKGAEVYNQYWTVIHQVRLYIYTYLFT